MLFSELKGRKVVDIATAETVGTVTDCIVDADRARIAALVLKKTAGDGDTLAWKDIEAVGPDAVTVAGATVVGTASAHLDELAAKEHDLHGKRVLTTSGVDLGKVSDLDIDATGGGIAALILKDGRIDGDRLLAAGAYAVVVQSRT